MPRDQIRLHSRGCGPLLRYIGEIAHHMKRESFFLMAERLEENGRRVKMEG